MNGDLRVRHCDDIDLTVCSLLFEEGALTDADTDFHLLAAHVVESRLYFRAFLLNEHVELYVNIAAEGLVLRVTI